MLSSELMKFIIMYQYKDFLPEKEAEKNDETPYKFHRFTKFAVVPIKVKR